MTCTTKFLDFFMSGLFLCFVTSQIGFTKGLSDSEQIKFDLSKYNSSNPNTHVQHLLYNFISENEAKIQITNIPDTVGFFILQTHTYGCNLTLSYYRDIRPNQAISGVNIGLVKERNGTTNHTLFLKDSKKNNATVFVVLIAYDTKAPIPGGCSMTFSTEIAPYQLISYNDDFVQVESQPPSVPGRICENTTTNFDVYHMYTDEADLSPETYFEGIRKLLTVNDIKTYGRKVKTPPVGYPKFRNIFAAYPGTGSIFAVVASYNNFSSAYVPAFSYACDIFNAESCFGPVSIFWKFVCAGFIFLGLFMCYFGHKFFYTEMFLMGILFGGLLAYIALFHIYIDSMSTEGITLIAVPFSLICGACWTFLWWRRGIPVLSVQLPIIIASFLFTSILLYSDAVECRSPKFVFFYWFLGISLGIIIAATAMSIMISNVVASSLLGSYAVTISIDHYMSTHLRYIVINSIRRMTNRKFQIAVVDPPFQTNDIVLTIVWIVLFGSGIWFQMLQQRRRPPFPPHRRYLSRDQERTPLITETESFPNASNFNYGAVSARGFAGDQNRL